MTEPPFRTVRAGDVNFEAAPDGSRVFPLIRCAGGSMAKFALPARGVSSRVLHRCVDELWYVLDGSGELWRRTGAVESVISLEPGVCADIPAGTAFQFRAGDEGLSIIATTMPPWPGDDEAIRVDGSTWFA